MDPQLIKELTRRRLILENSLKTTKTKDENRTKNIEMPSILNTDFKPSNNNKKSTLLERIRKFESLNNNQTKITQQNIIGKSRNNTEITNKFNKVDKDTVLLNNTLITNKLQNSNGIFIYSKQNQDNFHNKIKQFESFFITENKNLKGNTVSNVITEYPQVLNESTKTLKTKYCSKSDYNNWELDKNWVFYKNYSNLNNKQILLKSKLFSGEKKRIPESLITRKKYFM